MLLIGVLAVDPAYFYPRLGTDPLLYYLKGLAFAETGHTVARTAINRQPFNYAAMPGVMRAPFMMLFSDFDNQLRAIQLSNIVLVTITAVMFAYVLSWAVPIKTLDGHRLHIWLHAAQSELGGERVHAAGRRPVCRVYNRNVSARLVTSDRPSERPLAIAGAALLFVIAFTLKFTAPILVVFVALLAAGRPRDHAMSRRLEDPRLGRAVVGIALLVALQLSAIVDRYLPEPISFLRRGSAGTSGT